MGRTDATHFFGVHVADYSPEGIATMRAALAAKSDGRELDVTRIHSGTEDGYLWYFTREGIAIGDGGWMHEADALREALAIVLDWEERDYGARSASLRADYFCSCEHPIFDTEDPTWDGNCQRCARTVTIFRVRVLS